MGAIAHDVTDPEKKNFRVGACSSLRHHARQKTPMSAVQARKRKRSAHECPWATDQISTAFQDYAGIPAMELRFSAAKTKATSITLSTTTSTGTPHFSDHRFRLWPRPWRKPPNYSPSHRRWADLLPFDYAPQSEDHCQVRIRS